MSAYGATEKVPPAAEQEDQPKFSIGKLVLAGGLVLGMFGTVMLTQRHDPSLLELGAAPAGGATTSGPGETLETDDSVTVTRTFNKWTFTSGSAELAQENQDALWYGIPSIERWRRNYSESSFELVGPTGCEGEVERRWVSTEFTTADSGGDEIHWVWSDSDTVEHGEIAVSDWHEALKKANRDLKDFNQFMDQRYSYYVPVMDEYIKSLRQMAVKYDYPIRFRQGSWEEGRAFIAEFVNNDGAIFEVVSRNLENTERYASLFEDFEPCLFRPLTELTAYDDKLEKYNEVRGPWEIPSTSGDGSKTSDSESEDSEESESGKDGEETDENRKLYSITTKSYWDFPTPARKADRISSAIPGMTSIASTDPEQDAAWMMKFFGGDGILGNTYGGHDVSQREVDSWAKHEKEAGLEEGTCSSRVRSKWILFNNTGDTAYEPTYVRLAYHPDARAIDYQGEAYTLKKWEMYLRSLRSNMYNNTYDVFMDDHLGISVPVDTNYYSTMFGKLGLEFHDAGEPVLTRREPQPGDPHLYCTDGLEKFSMFVHFPVSYYAIQILAITSKESDLLNLGLPTFCDWDFCSKMKNYRSECDGDGLTEPKLLDSSTCGFSTLSKSHANPGKAKKKHDHKKHTETTP